VSFSIIQERFCPRVCICQEGKRPFEFSCVCVDIQILILSYHTIIFLKKGQNVCIIANKTHFQNLFIYFDKSRLRVFGMSVIKIGMKLNSICIPASTIRHYRRKQFCIGGGGGGVEAPPPPRCLRPCKVTIRQGYHSGRRKRNGTNTCLHGFIRRTFMEQFGIDLII
jgi:hypothetical protein